ncbi:galactokinase-like [Chelonus insularis]|uniref:galactokinase-like n=1 Tax=Chelonus insularis TaxID=460826 RepID=UPI00158C438B|nr:galactokinase-like [Chelonus insularis]XP_034940509.1 galactokinase-like [Chelonus insularis]XP_034940510.1 galactokinase-like [Chelonus insularis]
MASNIKKVDNVRVDALNTFAKEFGDEATCCVCAPGRVNLIGEHTDYNEGFVLPMALPLVTVIAGKPNGTNKCVIISTNESITTVSKIEFDVSNRESIKPGEPKWANYMKGCMVNFPVPIPGFNAVVVSSVPMGSGLSSSAALEVATYTFLEALTGTEAKDPRDKALACQKAEHDFANVPCGIMDQFISVMGKEDHALLIDCRDLSVTHVPMDQFHDHVFLITNSNSPHKLSTSAYRERRDACFEAAQKLGKKSLRDVTLDEVETLKQQGAPQIMLKRVTHVINENARTLAATSAFQSGDYTKVGQLMNESHDSLRDNYNVSSPELDALVNAARKVQGVRGSRLTGAGFGGCTITFVLKTAVDEVIKSINESYSGKASFYIATPSGGARKLDCKR